MPLISKFVGVAGAPACPDWPLGTLLQIRMRSIDSGPDSAHLAHFAQTEDLATALFTRAGLGREQRTDAQHQYREIPDTARFLIFLGFQLPYTWKQAYSRGWDSDGLPIFDEHAYNSLIAVVAPVSEIRSHLRGLRNTYQLPMWNYGRCFVARRTGVTLHERCRQESYKITPLGRHRTRILQVQIERHPVRKLLFADRRLVQAARARQEEAQHGAAYFRRTYPTWQRGQPEPTPTPTTGRLDELGRVTDGPLGATLQGNPALAAQFNEDIFVGADPAVTAGQRHRQPRFRAPLPIPEGLRTLLNTFDAPAPATLAPTVAPDDPFWTIQTIPRQ